MLDILGPGWMEGRLVWDLFAGSGAFGLEALGCGAERAAFVDRNPRSCRLVRSFLRERAALERAVIIRGDVRRGIHRIGFGPDLVFADPPYDYETAYDLLRELAWDRLCRPGARVFVEGGPDVRMPGWKRREYGSCVLFELRTEGKR